MPDRRARSASGTPVQRCWVDQPSVHAMGRSAVVSGMANSWSRLRETRRGPTSVRRQSGPVVAAVIPAEAEVWLTGNRLAPTPGER